MKTLLALLLSVVLCVGLEYGPQEIEGFVQAAGKKKVLDGKEYMILEVPKKVWETVNTGRKLSGRAVYPYETLEKIHQHNREYIADWVNLVKADLITVLSREPSAEELFVGWYMGMKAFKKLNYQLKGLPEDVELRLKVFSSVKVDRRAMNIHEPPPPLPTDRKPAVSRTYTQDWPKVEDVRVRFK